MAGEIRRWRRGDDSIIPKIDWCTTYFDIESQDRVANFLPGIVQTAKYWQDRAVRDADRKIAVLAQDPRMYVLKGPRYDGYDPTEGFPE
jgi:hypothetical protein